jgi:sigma54-dependent transcription regulator
LLIGIVLLIAFGYFKYGFTYSKGYRAGLLQKFSEKGVLFKTYEGELILSSVQSSSNVAIASEKFLFSVEDKDVAKQMERIQGKHVVVHYKEKNGALPWRGDSHYIVDSVRVDNVAGGTHNPN